MNMTSNAKPKQKVSIIVLLSNASLENSINPPSRGVKSGCQKTTSISHRTHRDVMMMSDENPKGTNTPCKRMKRLCFHPPNERVTPLCPAKEGTKQHPEKRG
jgi:hypothetical protein